MDDTSAEMGQVTPGVTVERRRVGRIEGASPELIALMRRPSADTLRAIRLYDAPNFQPSQAHQADRRTARRRRRRLVAAACVCAGASVAAFETMLWVWN